MFGEEGNEFHFKVNLTRNSHRMKNNPLPEKTFRNTSLEPEVTMKNRNPLIIFKNFRVEGGDVVWNSNVQGMRKVILSGNVIY